MKIYKTAFSVYNRKVVLVSAAALTLVFSATIWAQPITPILPPIQTKLKPSLPSGDIDTTATDQELAEWAWQQFVALGWESTYTDQKPERGVANTDIDLKTALSPNVAVWETFAHRQELRPWGEKLKGTFEDLKAPNYRIGSVLQKASAETKFNLLNNLDEDNEIGSALVYLRAPDKNDKTDNTKSSDKAKLILYQAKVNADEFNYIAKTFPDQHNPNGSLAIAAKNNAQNIKSFKTSVVDENGKPVASNCETPKGVANNKFIILPCGIGAHAGAIEIKTAFMNVDDYYDKQSYLKSDDPLSEFLIRDAIYYTANDDGSFTYHNGKFALLGIHIIRKTKHFPGFIFTSFEHKSLQQGLEIDGKKNYFHFKRLAPGAPEYGNFVNPDFDKAKNLTPGTAYGDYVKIERQKHGKHSPTSNGKLYPVSHTIEKVNSAYQRALAANESVWANYRLIGVQAQPTTSYSAKSSSDNFAGPNHFMANFIIESDSFLGNFFGPGFSSTNPVFKSGKEFPDGSYNGDNIVRDLKSYNMGGCKGCHGVAATAFGTDTSFLLDFGAGKPVKEPDTIHYIAPKKEKK
ncbi:MAG: hypothetical protein KTR16_14305 [Acidiferrobacterales bacterium]|nr:hypothetical protein [Acidiferrobacterales bacterium]